MMHFKAMYGHEPRRWGITSLSTCYVPSLQAWLHERGVIQDLLQQHLNRANEHIKAQAAKHRSPWTFSVGGEIISKVNDVAFKLDLPHQAQVHPVFHVSELRRYVKLGTPISSALSVHSHIPAVLVKVLQSRWRKKHGAMVEQVRVRWSNEASMDETWEDKIDLQARFPSNTFVEKLNLVEKMII